MILGTKWKIGQRVTCKQPEPAYYSGYGGAPVCSFEPSMDGIVVDVIPPVRGNLKYLVLVDFIDYRQPTESQFYVRRCALAPGNVVAL